jgi:DNA-directed RNA polymerase subunit M/transcription elongation factor TFIIS
MKSPGARFRTCPSCGHRFHVKQTGETLLSDKRKAEPVGRDGMMIVGGAAAGVWGVPRGKVWSLTPTGPQEEQTFMTERKEFEDSFECSRCGHKWVEKRSEENERS